MFALPRHLLRHLQRQLEAHHRLLPVLLDIQFLSSDSSSAHPAASRDVERCVPTRSFDDSLSQLSTANWILNAVSYRVAIFVPLGVQQVSDHVPNGFKSHRVRVTTLTHSASSSQQTKGRDAYCS